MILKETVDNILMSLGPTLRKSQHNLRCDIADGIMLDSYPGYLAQIVTNLVNNALLHGLESRPDGEIAISAKLVDDASVALVVSDNGAGI
ncbi:MAG: hypothetical protein U5M53_03330 [Rhodoferax sp.]|nr:hypothetical protein [Rhodoferax sp.]